MNLTVNMLFLCLEEPAPPRIERILWIEQGGSRIATIDIQDKKAWPILHDRTFLEERFASGAIHQLKNDPYQHLRQPDQAFKHEYRVQRDQAYELIQDIVEHHEGELFFSCVLGPLVQKAVKAARERMRSSAEGGCEKERPKVRGCTKTTAYQYLRLYWQRGQTPNALLPAYDGCGAKGLKRTLHGPKRGRPSKKALQNGLPTGVNITDKIKEIFRQGTRIFYDTPKRLCAKASGLGLCQASHHDADHGEVNPGFFAAGEHLIVFGKPTPG